MNGRFLSLEDFLKPLEDGELSLAQVPEPPAGQPDGAGLEAYERGYKAGWDDCQNQDAGFRKSVGAEFAQSLQELGFTFHEARAHVIAGLDPLFEALIAKLMPETLCAALGQQLVAQLKEMAEQSADAPIQILAAAENCEFLSEYAATVAAGGFAVTAEETLTEDQVMIRLGPHERRIDLTALTDALASQIRAFTDETRKVLKNG